MVREGGERWKGEVAVGGDEPGTLTLRWKMYTHRREQGHGTTVMPENQTLDPLNEIDLDPYNPRLRAAEEGSPPDKLLQIMINRFKIDELAESIISGGYLAFDPMLAYRLDGRITVREGNRRLAAMKLLLDPELAPEKQRARWSRLGERLPAETREQIRTIEVEVYEDRDHPDLRSYIGFRHVTGVLQWPALEKATFIGDLVESAMPFEEIANRLGSYPAHVRRHYLAYRLVKQARDSDVPGHENIEKSFGVLLRALQSPGIAEFFGLSDATDPPPEPVPADRLPQLTEFVRWTFGTNDVKRILPESRRLSDFGKILQSAEALRYLRSTSEPSFDRAWIKSGGQAESIAAALWTAAYRLEEAVPVIIDYRDNTEIREAVRDNALFLAQILQHFPELREEFGIGIRGD